MEAKVFPTDEPKVDLDYSSLEKEKDLLIQLRLMYGQKFILVNTKELK